MQNKILLQFTEEAILNPKFSGFIGGRIEVYRNEDEYPSEEIRFLTAKTEEFNTFRDMFDFVIVEEQDLNLIRMIVHDSFS
jgi:hypothetical protein